VKRGSKNQRLASAAALQKLALLEVQKIRASGLADDAVVGLVPLNGVDQRRLLPVIECIEPLDPITTIGSYRVLARRAKISSPTMLTAISAGVSA
jgi:hypothetical protein